MHVSHHFPNFAGGALSVTASNPLVSPFRSRRTRGQFRGWPETPLIARAANRDAADAGGSLVSINRRSAAHRNQSGPAIARGPRRCASIFLLASTLGPYQSSPWIDVVLFLSGSLATSHRSLRICALWRVQSRTPCGVPGPVFRFARLRGPLLQRDQDHPGATAPISGDFPCPPGHWRPRHDQTQQNQI